MSGQASMENVMKELAKWSQSPSVKKDAALVVSLQRLQLALTTGRIDLDLASRIVCYKDVPLLRENLIRCPVVTSASPIATTPRGKTGPGLVLLDSSPMTKKLVSSPTAPKSLSSALVSRTLFSDNSVDGDMKPASQAVTSGAAMKTLATPPRVMTKGFDGSDLLRTIRPVDRVPTQAIVAPLPFVARAAVDTVSVNTSIDEKKSWSVRATWESIWGPCASAMTNFWWFICCIASTAGEGCKSFLRLVGRVCAAIFGGIRKLVCKLAVLVKDMVWYVLCGMNSGWCVACERTGSIRSWVKTKYGGLRDRGVSFWHSAVKCVKEANQKEMFIFWACVFLVVVAVFYWMWGIRVSLLSLLSFVGDKLEALVGAATSVVSVMRTEWIDPSYVWTRDCFWASSGNASMESAFFYKEMNVSISALRRDVGDDVQRLGRHVAEVVSGVSVLNVSFQEGLEELSEELKSVRAKMSNESALHEGHTRDHRVLAQKLEILESRLTELSKANQQRDAATVSSFAENASNQNHSYVQVPQEFLKKIVEVLDTCARKQDLENVSNTVSTLGNQQQALNDSLTNLQHNLTVVQNQSDGLSQEVLALKANVTHVETHSNFTWGEVQILTQSHNNLSAKVSVLDHNMVMVVFWSFKLWVFVAMMLVVLFASPVGHAVVSYYLVGTIFKDESDCVFELFVFGRFKVSDFLSIAIVMAVFLAAFHAPRNVFANM